jgi:magnesium chelatase subunit H
LYLDANDILTLTASSPQQLGNDRQSWSDELLGHLPNIYAYAANNPSESILAKRRGYGTLVSYNVPPYGRAGLYLELANLKELLDEYRSGNDRDRMDAAASDIRATIWCTAQKAGLGKDVPPLCLYPGSGSEFDGAELPDGYDIDAFNTWITSLSDYLFILQDRLFSSGLHVLGASPSDEEMKAYLNAYFGAELSEDDCDNVVKAWHESKPLSEGGKTFMDEFLFSIRSFLGEPKKSSTDDSADGHTFKAAQKIVSLLSASTEEMDSIVNALDGGYVPAKPGGDLLRDGTSVLPTGKNIYALDPYRMPSATAWARGQRVAKETLRQHKEMNSGRYPETVAVTLWGLDAIKTRGESVAIVLALVGAEPVKEGTGRIVRFDLVPLKDLGRPRVDVLASLSGIFRDSFANVVDLLDDMFERAAAADEPVEMNYIKKHADALRADGVERPAARLFSNPPGDYGSMVNEVVGTGDWSETEALGETWKGRNVFSYGRGEGTGVGTAGTARPRVLEKLLETTERVVQEIDSVEYGLSDIQEYYANTGKRWRFENYSN